MRALLRQVEDLFDVASAGTGSTAAAIVLGNDGGFRLIDPAGWSLPALRDEFGATAVFKVERRGERVRIEACDRSERCLMEGAAAASCNQSKTGRALAPAFSITVGALQVPMSHPEHRAALIGPQHYSGYPQNQGVDVVQQKRPVYL